MEKVILSKLSFEELEKICLEMGQSKFRARQIHNQIFLKFASNFDLFPLNKDESVSAIFLKI